MKARLIISMVLCLGITSCTKQQSESHSTSSKIDSSYVMSDIQLYAYAQDGIAIFKKSVGYLRNKDSVSPVNGGDLKINAVSIPIMHGGHGATYYGVGDSGKAPLVLDGSWHKFSLSGSAAFPAFIDSIRSPIGATAITSPHTGDTISKSSGFSITWNANTTGGVSIMVLDTSSAVGHRYIDTTLTSDPGSISFSSAQLSALTPGPLTLTVTRGGITYGIAGQHFRYRIGIGSALTVSLNLKP